MTSWAPQIKVKGSAGPIYRAITDTLARDIESGRLPAGSRLPTQRELADRLGVTLGTISRAFNEAARRGLIQGEVGRGTYVRGASGDEATLASLGGGDASLIDLSLNFPVFDPQTRALPATFASLAARDDLGFTLAYQPNAGAHRHREAGAAWIGRSGLEAKADQVLVCSGAQHAMAVVFGAITRPGDLVVTEALTYTGMKTLANFLHLRLLGLAMDEHGMLPEAFDAACRAGKVKALYCTPTIQNPTATVLPVERREAIAAVARKHDVTIVEDDTYGFLAPEKLPRLASFAPERSCFLTSASKSLAPGLRIGYLMAPPGMIERLTSAIITTCWMASPLTAEIASGWIEDGTADRMVEWRRKEAAARQEIVRRVLGDQDYSSHPSSFHLWLRLPEPWRGEEFAARSRLRGAAVTPPGAFAVGRGAVPRAVRVCVGAVGSRSRLEEGLRILAEILKGSPEPGPPVL